MSETGDKGPGESDDGRFRTCDVCGQTFDTTDPDQIFHHDSDPHDPLEQSEA